MDEPDANHPLLSSTTGPDFIRKHLINKYSERLEEVRQEAKYFNNYVRDVKRMQLPEHPANRPPAPVNTRAESNNQGAQRATAVPEVQPVSVFQMRAQSRLVAQPGRLLP